MGAHQYRGQFENPGWYSRQTPDALLVLPSMQKWPGMHGPVHSRVVCPGAPPYLPAAHNSGSDAPNSHAWPIGQSSHSSAAARLSEPENRPAAHGIEAALPSGHCVGQMNLTQLMSAGPQDWPESIPACPHVGSPRTRLWARRRCRAQATRRAVIHMEHHSACEHGC